MTSFGALLDDAKDGWRVPASWAQGRSVFGGLGAAAALRVASKQVTDRPLRSLQVAFSGPLRPETETRFTVRKLREGRSATAMAVDVAQGDAVACAVLATFSAARESTVEIAGPPMPDAPSAKDANRMPYIEGITPAFTQHVEMCWVRGQFPYTGAEVAELAGWVKLHDASGLSFAELVVAYVDAWPSPVLSVLDGPAAASSATWQLDLIPQAIEDGHWFFESEPAAAADGFAQMQSRLWTPSGKLAATSTQTVAVFA